MRFRHRRDANAKAIIEAWKAAGASFDDTSQGRSKVDGYLGYLGVTIPIEFKQQSGVLSQGQQDHIETWRGSPVQVVRSMEEGLALLRRQ